MAVLKYLICGYLIGQKWLKMAKMAKIGQKNQKGPRELPISEWIKG